MRLGASLLFVNKENNDITIFYFSTAMKYNPDLSKFIYFCASWNTITGQNYSENAKHHKKLIFDSVKNYFSEQEVVNSIEGKEGVAIYILDL